MSKIQGTFSLTQPSPAFLESTLPSTEPTHYLLASSEADAFLDEGSFAITSEGIVTHVDDSGAETTVFLEGVNNSPNITHSNVSVERMLVPNMFERSHSQVLLQTPSDISSAHMGIASTSLMTGGRHQNEAGNTSVNDSASNIEAITFNLPVDSSQD